MFEYSSHYIMDSGHAALEVVTGGLNLLTEHNEARYEGINVAGNQVSEILAQVGAMIKEEGNDSPLSGLEVRNMILAGTSATAGILIRYLPGHMVYRTPGMELIYDGFMPTSNGSAIQRVDVPLIHVPTMTETSGGATPIRQDSEEPGDQYRVFEFAGMAHVDTRDSVRFKPDPCRFPISTYPLQAYMAVALHHLFEWVDKGTIPPRAPRILVDRDASNDGSLMSLDEHGNAIGGIRSPYVDVPTTKLGVRNEGANPLISNASAYIAAGGLPAANQMCGLGGYEMAMSDDQLRALYGDKASYQSMVRERIEELEREGWSLPVYRDMIMADAANVDF
jgi:hypothetical protein